MAGWVFTVQPRAGLRHLWKSLGASAVQQKEVFHVRLQQGVEPEWVFSQSGPWNVSLQSWIQSVACSWTEEQLKLCRVRLQVERSSYGIWLWRYVGIQWVGGPLSCPKITLTRPQKMSVLREETQSLHCPSNLLSVEDEAVSSPSKAPEGNAIPRPQGSSVPPFLALAE